ncbi:MAG: hypothetical protein AAGJ87_05185 [Pseudomonadota bacterium]
MTGYELHDLLAANRELISDTWQYFLSVHLAIFGIVYIASGRIHLIERLVLIGAYLSFMFMNFNAQMDNYGNYVRIVNEIFALPETAAGAAQAKAILKADPVWVADSLLHVYCAAAIVSSLIILLINRDRG